MPNGFKIIMGVARLNRILGIYLGIHDIKDVYDLCKSGGGDNTYSIRVKANWQCFVNELEDSNRYARDDLLFVWATWSLVRLEWRGLTGFPAASGPLQVNTEHLAFFYFSSFVSAELTSSVC